MAGKLGTESTFLTGSSLGHPCCLSSSTSHLHRQAHLRSVGGHGRGGWLCFVREEEEDPAAEAERKEAFEGKWVCGEQTMECLPQLYLPCLLPTFRLGLGERRKQELNSQHALQSNLLDNEMLPDDMLAQQILRPSSHSLYMCAHTVRH